MTQEYQRDTDDNDREKNHAAKAQLELKLVSTVGDNIKGFYKYINSKRWDGYSIGLYLMRDIDKAEIFNAFFASAFNTNDGPWATGAPAQKTKTAEHSQFQTNAFVCI